jgi:hypothetical protein
LFSRTESSLITEKPRTAVLRMRRSLVEEEAIHTVLQGGVQTRLQDFLAGILWQFEKVETRVC